MVRKDLAVTVVIPTYNSEKFIHILLESLTNQSMDQSLFEVIIINDCSTDETEKVVLKYKTKIQNLKLLKTPENTGNPIAGRNIGIDIAKGEYIHFVDHDDYLGEESLEKLYSSAKKWNSDVIFGKFVPVIDNKPNYNKVTEVFKHGNIENLDPFIHPYALSYLAPHRMFRRQFINDNKIRYDKNVKHGEDVFFVMTSFANAKRISVLSDYVFYYRTSRVDGGNLTNKQKSHSYYVKNYKTFRIIQEINKTSLNTDYKRQWIKLYLHRYLGLKGHGGHVLTPHVNLERMDVINRLVIDPAGDDIINSLNSEYKLIVDLAKLRESNRRDLLLGSILRPSINDVTRLADRIHIRSYDGVVYDASMLYRKLDISILKLDVINNKLVVDIKTSVLITFDDKYKYYINFQDRSNKYKLSNLGVKIAKNTYRFEVDIKNLVNISQSDIAEYSVNFQIKGSYIDITTKLYSRNVLDYNEKLINNPGERYLYRNRVTGDGRLFALFQSRKHPLLHRIRNIIS